MDSFSTAKMLRPGNCGSGWGPIKWWEVALEWLTSHWRSFPLSEAAMAGGVRFSDLGYFSPAARSPLDPILRMTSEGTDGPIYHIPVLEEEVVSALEPGPGKIIMDGTLGGGGHTARLLRAGASVLAFDQDPEALEYTRNRLWGSDADVDGRLVAIHANFASFPEVLAEAGTGAVLDGLLLDLGVSSHQLGSGERGFSFNHQGPLDMRMNPEGGLTAADIVNTWTEEELARIFYEYGEEKASRRVAKMIAARRAVEPFTTTGDFAEAVATVIPRRGPANPATRVFQALRIAVNDELGVLETALQAAHHWLKPGGRLAVISFHSLEDRICKLHLRRHSEAEIDRPEWPAPRPNPECYYRLVSRKAISASGAETARNPRSRTAKLRVAERLP